MSAGQTIEYFDIPDALIDERTEETSINPGAPINIAEVLRARERDLVIAALQAESGVQARAAKRLGVSRANLNYRIQKLGIVIKEIVYD